MIAIGHTETRFRNLKGDGGESLGYFQIQEETYWFVKEKYKKLYEKKDFNLAWTFENITERKDIQYITSVLFLDYLKNRFPGQEYKYYNGGSDFYQKKITEELKKIKKDFEEYKY